MDNFVLRDQDLFLVANPEGEIDPAMEGAGLYTKDTRFLSSNRLTIDNEKPELLSKHAQSDNLSTFRYLHEVPDKGAVEVIKEPLIYKGCFYEKLTFTNYFPEDYQFQASMEYDVDFQDMFIVRGFRSGVVGERTGVTNTENSLLFSYKGKDNVLRETCIEWDSELQTSVNENKLTFDMSLKVKESRTITMKVIPMIEKEEVHTYSYEKARIDLAAKYKSWYASLPSIEVDDPHFKNMYDQATKDLQMLLIDIGYGDITVAGVPWYSVPFGRDSIITALFMLSVKPDLAKNTIRTLATYQGKENNPEKDEEPGKIMHELRFGELSTTGQTPFTPYYGTVDATPLFLLLATEYYHWTKDDDFIKEMKPHFDAALNWIRHKENDGTNSFVQYEKKADKGIPNQGWKDSSNSMVHKDGAYAESPIALIEVQGYVYAVKKGLSSVYAELGYNDESETLLNEASQLSTDIEESYWMEEGQFYALALDGNNEKICSITSNSGHLLFAEVTHTDAIVNRLLKNDLNSGYGVRTMSSSEVGYYPMSYHNGSVWPHDNGMILLGLHNKLYMDASKTIMTQLLDASRQFEDQRIPELYCGYDRENDLLIPYPTTCSPQAWSAATALLYVQLISGIQPNGVTKTIQIQPNLLDSMNQMTMSNIPVGDGFISLQLTRSSTSKISYEIIKNTTGYSIIS